MAIATIIPTTTIAEIRFIGRDSKYEMKKFILKIVPTTYLIILVLTNQHYRLL